MDMVETSSSLYTTVDRADTLVPLFCQSSALVTESGSGQARQRLVQWAWTNLYLDSLSNGIVLPAQFYTDLCTLLATSQMVQYLVEVLHYTALLPCLALPLAPLAAVLAGPPVSFTDVPSTPLLLAQTLPSLTTSDWISLSKLGDI